MAVRRCRTTRPWSSTPGRRSNHRTRRCLCRTRGVPCRRSGTPTDPVTFTSYNDASVGGATNDNPDTNPFAGDWGGIIFRNYDETNAAQRVAVPGRRNAGRPEWRRRRFRAPRTRCRSLNYSQHPVCRRRRAAGLEQIPDSAITLFNSRPAITNTDISLSGGTGGTESAIGADMDSFREDDTARGPLIRQVTVSQNSLNAIWLMSEANGYIEPTTAMTYPTNPLVAGGIDQLHVLRAPAVHRAGRTWSSARSSSTTPAGRRSG